MNSVLLGMQGFNIMYLITVSLYQRIDVKSNCINIFFENHSYGFT